MFEIRHRFVEANGLRFHIAECGGGNRLALCLHGFPENWCSWRNQLPLLAELGYLAWAPDLRGYGQTDKPRGVSHYAVDHLVGDVGALIDASQAKDVVLIGHDWGGAVAWASAIQNVRPIERLVIMNCPHPVQFFKGILSLKQLRRSWYMFFFQLPVIPERWLAADGAKRIGRAFRAMAIDKSHFSDNVLAEYQREALRPGALTGMLSYLPRAIPAKPHWPRESNVALETGRGDTAHTGRGR
jgi:pimeloyl-ACP methyl ester carboxylesterase